MGNGSIINDYYINCGNNCQYNFIDQSESTLIAIPDNDWIFDSWADDCDSNGEVLMNNNRICTAIFKQEFSLNVTVIGHGNVNGCSVDCINTYL